ncbi:hypothetical protein J6524_19630 [Bradyrhizobium sp. WSM 1738]|uniref:hypothetical protein n=1 Tax=Bradyrhizobium hereditatis TaxID=2821405 RepID=UPI001CE3121C|nr:hypothetical protein [Bradyrhizobium hereditatis]MCA6117067.1 hypothetical protein [Bradyrhizobium hereditatis]
MKLFLAGISALLLLGTPASADPWKDESGHGRWKHERGYRAYGYERGYDRDYKQEFYRGPCKIERKWERNGEYKEETKCKGYR